MIDLFKLMGTLQTPNSTGIGASVSAVAGFFGFFASELSRTYLTRRPNKPQD